MSVEEANYIDAYYHLLWIFYWRIAVNTLCLFNLDTHSIYVGACQLNEVCIRLCEKIQYWHQRNVLLAYQKH